MKTAAKKHFRSARTFRPRIGDRISFGGFVYTISANPSGGVAFKEDSDPFYSEANMNYLKQQIAEAEAGRFTEHELIEA